MAQVYNSIGVDLVPGRSDTSVVPEDIARSPELLSRGVLKIPAPPHPIPAGV